MITKDDNAMKMCQWFGEKVKIIYSTYVFWQITFKPVSKTRHRNKEDQIQG
jgi:hypothetical protein